MFFRNKRNLCFVPSALIWRKKRRKKKKNDLTSKEIFNPLILYLFFQRDDKKIGRNPGFTRVIMSERKKKIIKDMFMIVKRQLPDSATQFTVSCSRNFSLCQLLKSSLPHFLNFFFLITTTYSCLVSSPAASIGARQVQLNLFPIMLLRKEKENGRDIYPECIALSRVRMYRCCCCKYRFTCMTHFYLKCRCL